jgi:hypothetical protein
VKLQLLQIILAVAVLSTPTLSQTSKRIFLLQDKNSSWCGYKNKAEWSSDVETDEAETVGSLEYSANKLTTINVTEDDESGDWTVYDTYRINNGGEIVELKRTINIIPGDRSEQDFYTFETGRPKLKSSEVRSLSTQKKSEPSSKETWRPNVPIVTEIGQFPFNSFLLNNHFLLSSNVKECVPRKKIE